MVNGKEMQDDSDPIVSRSEEKQPEDSFLPVTIPQFCAYFTGRKIADTMESAKEKTRTGNHKEVTIMKKVLIVNASKRRNGNSYAMAKRFAE